MTTHPFESRGSAATLILLLLAASAAAPVWTQTPAGQSANTPSPVRPDYVLGPEDQIVVRTAQVPEIHERPFRIDSDGMIDLPIAGRMKAGGLTLRAFEAELLTRLREFVVSPQVFVTLVQLRGDPVFFVGAFRAPGIYPLTGPRTLIEMLSSVGGVLPTASRRIRITRRAEFGTIPLPNAIESPDKRISTLEINMESLSESVNPAEDIVLQPYDIVSAERAEKVYVSGEVARAASIELGERTSISVAQALTEAGGLLPTSKRSKVRVLRPISGTNRRAEILIDAGEIFAGKARDFALLPNDVLYVPRSAGPPAILAAAAPGMVASLPFVLVSIIATRR